MSILAGAQAHYKQDYAKIMKDLLAVHPLEEAVALAVGGTYNESGRIQEGLMKLYGVEKARSILDIGCGSGRLATRMSSWYKGSYLGIDPVKELIQYADERTPENFRFLEVNEIAIAAEDESIELACAFSVFTHLLFEEIYIYLQEVKRVLIPSGRFIFSFLEFGGTNHMAVFAESVGAYKIGRLAALNMFIERTTIETFAQYLGFRVECFHHGQAPFIPIDEPVIIGGQTFKGFSHFGQTVAVLRKT